MRLARTVKRAGFWALCAALVFVIWSVWTALVSHPSPTRDVALHHAGTGEALIVIFGGSEGGFLRHPRLISRLNSEGFQTASLAYFGFPGGPQQLSEINLDAIAQTIQAESAHFQCVGLLGVSKGAELALTLAARFDLAQATVAVVPSHVVWQSSAIRLFRASSWQLAGAPLPFVPYEMLSLAALRAASDPDQALALHELSLAQQADWEAAVIPVEMISHPVLLQAAERDQIWPSLAMSRQILDRANRLRPGHAIALSPYAHNHYLLNAPAVRDDLVAFFQTHLQECR